MENSRNFVLLPPEAGDQSDRVSYNEKLVQDMYSTFEPGGTLERRKTLVDDILEVSASTSDADVYHISESNDYYLSNTKPTRKRRKLHQRNKGKGRIPLNGLKGKISLLIFNFLVKETDRVDVFDNLLSNYRPRISEKSDIFP